MTEQASLNQVRSILHEFPICFMAPERMRSFMKKKNERAEFFPDDCFNSVHSYSRLLLTEDFYVRFKSYEYILIYQLDAFVFSNRLKEFCSMGYDYIGAPMPYWSGWRTMPTRVGNGGLSLRRVEACRRVVCEKKGIYDKSGRKDEFEAAEDMFFGYCGADPAIDFYIPNTMTALSFSVEFDVGGAWRKLSMGMLPFGCHAWSKKRYFALWKPYLEKYIPNLSQISSEIERKQELSYAQTRRLVLDQYLLERICRKWKDDKRRQIVDVLFPIGRELVLWGTGEIGKRAMMQCKALGLDVTAFLDSDPNKTMVEDIPVIVPNDGFLRTYNPYVIVAVTKPNYANEIISRLQAAAMTNGKDFMLYADWLRVIVAAYYCKDELGTVEK